MFLHQTMLLPCLYFVFSIIQSANSLNDEGLALLSFKRSLSTAVSLQHWNSSDSNPCSWLGVHCKHQTVIALDLSNLQLSGILHLNTQKLVSLRHLNLSHNSFSGSLPHHIGKLNHLRTLDLSHNSFNGSITSSLLQCKNLKQLHLNRNNFSGSLPNGFGSDLVKLQQLNLSFNSLSGPILSDFSNLLSLKGVADLSHNHFNGTIPETLGNLPQTLYIDLSYNNLSGSIPQNEFLMNLGPTSFIGNPLLCGLPLKTPCSSVQKPLAHYLPKAKTNRSLYFVMGIIAGTLLGIAFFVALVSYWYKRTYAYKGNKQKDNSVIRREMFCFKTDELETLSENMDEYVLVRFDSGVKFDLEQLLKSDAFLLGKSRTGIVYKVVPEKGPTVAVRRLEDGGSQTYREFQTEVEAIGKIRHPHVVSLLGYCWCANEKLLIYEFVPNGDLAAAIHGNTGMMYFKPLSWSVRLQIMKRTAKGLAFLHEFSPKKYVHGNIKPSNILLGENMEPRISDFGNGRLNRTAKEPSAEQLGNGTPPQGSPYTLTPTNSSPVMSYYEAPEATRGGKPSQKWDVYSFGVIILEMMTGKSAVVQGGSGEVGLVQWVQLSAQVKPLSHVLDDSLVHDVAKLEEMAAVLEIGLACVQTIPDKRPSMRNVSDSLEKLASGPKL